jgi:hypothetical protein
VAVLDTNRGSITRSRSLAAIRWAAGDAGLPKHLIAAVVLLVASVVPHGSTADGFSAECPPAGPLPASDVLLGYIGEVRTTTNDGGTTRVGPFRAFAILRNGQLIASDGASIRNDMKFWQIAKPSASAVVLRGTSSFLDRLGEDHCVFSAEPDPSLPSWTLLSSRPLGEMFSPPSEADSSYFGAHQDICVDQGDYEPSNKPPCTRPMLLAISDLDRDGAKEYWSTQPYLWDTGIAVWQRTEAGLNHIMEVCAGCSD